MQDARCYAAITYCRVLALEAGCEDDEADGLLFQHELQVRPLHTHVRLLSSIAGCKSSSVHEIVTCAVAPVRLKVCSKAFQVRWAWRCSASK